MANARELAGVGTGETAQDVGRILSAMVVERRRTSNVGAALNGAPRACSEARAFNVRRDAQREDGAPHYEGTVALDFCDIADGVPVEEVNAWHARAIAANTAHAAALRGEDARRPLKLLSRTETVKQGALDVAQHDLDENDPASVERMLTRIYGYLPTLMALQEAGEAHLAVIRGKARPVYGARRGHIQLHA